MATPKETLEFGLFLKLNYKALQPASRRRSREKDAEKVRYLVGHPLRGRSGEG
jgi:hypothetical protein